MVVEGIAPPRKTPLFLPAPAFLGPFRRAQAEARQVEGRRRAFSGGAVAPPKKPIFSPSPAPWGRRGGGCFAALLQSPSPAPWGRRPPAKAPTRQGKGERKRFSAEGLPLRTSPFGCDRPCRGKATGGGLAHAVPLMRIGRPTGSPLSETNDAVHVSFTTRRSITERGAKMSVIHIKGSVERIG